MEELTQKQKWPNHIRLEMIEKSEFYNDPKLYQYGYYDGYQKCLAESKSPEILKILQELLLDLEEVSIPTSILDTITRSEKLIKEATEL